MSKRELTDNEKAKLKEHGKHHTKKHIQRMTSMMKGGLSFSKAHTATRAIERDEKEEKLKKSQKKKPPAKKQPAKRAPAKKQPEKQTQTQSQVVNIYSSSRRQARAKPKSQQTVRDKRFINTNARMAYGMITTPSTANISMLQADVNYLRNQAVLAQNQRATMSQQQAIHNNDRLARTPQIPISRLSTRASELSRQDAVMPSSPRRNVVPNIPVPQIEALRKQVDFYKKQTKVREEAVEQERKDRDIERQTERQVRESEREGFERELMGQEDTLSNLGKDIKNMKATIVSQGNELIERDLAEFELAERNRELSDDLFKSETQRKRNLTRARKAEAQLEESKKSKERGDEQKEQLEGRMAGIERKVEEFESIPSVVVAQAMVPYDPRLDPSLIGDPVGKGVGASPVQDPNVDQPPLDINV